MEVVAEIVGTVLILAGSFFFVVGAVGIYRLPDVFTRMHAAGIADTVGAGLLLIGMMFFAGFDFVTVKLVIILGIIWFASPFSTHALAQAALHAGVEPRLASGKTVIGPGAELEMSSSQAKSKPAAKRTAKRRAPARRKTNVSRSRKGRATS